jgi:hypothetical protein
MHGPLPSRDSEAKIEYRDGAFRVIVPGSFVICAVSGRRIPLDSLRYWNVERQEPYADAAAALEALRRGR